MSTHPEKQMLPLPEDDYPVLWRVLRDRGLPFEAMYTTEEVAAIFGAAPRTMEEWFQDGRIQSRNLPKRKRCLAIDLENFFRDSAQKLGFQPATEVEFPTGMKREADA